jgi:long-chain acyl-CoA synthetase
LAYWLVTALFNVFPLPRGAGLRQSFAHAGEAMDQGYHVLVFPEGGRSHDGQLQPFEPGIGLLAQESEVPVQPIVIEGLKPLGKKWPARGAVTVRLGTPLTMEPGEEPQSFTKRLETAVAALQQRGMETICKQ